MNSRLSVILAVLLLLALTPDVGHGASTVYVVDVEKVLTRSRSAQAGQAHVKDARKALEQGFEQLRQLYDKQPEEARQRVLSDGANALSRQLALEQQAVNNVVANMMMEEIKAWRQANKADLVIAKQNLLDASDAVDITDAIIQNMDTKTPKFADLPVVSVNPPGAEEKPKK